MTIRRQPSDFRVEESLDAAFAQALQTVPSQATPFAVYVLHKTSLTTPEAVSMLGKVLRVEAGAVEYGGLKDKHAQTTQHVSIAVPGKEEAANLLATVRQPGWSAERIGWSPQPMSAKAIGANRFTLVVRDLSKTESDNMTRRSRKLLERPPTDAPDAPSTTLLFTNYFGAQRFGSARHGEGWIAQKLIAGDFEGALKLAIATPARKDTGKTRDFTRMTSADWGNWKKLAKELPRIPEAHCIDALAAGKDFKDAFAQLPSFLQALYLEAFQSHIWNRTAHALLTTGVHSGARIKADDEFGEMLFTDAAAIPAELKSLNLPLLAPSIHIEDHPVWSAAAAGVLSAQDPPLTTADLRIPGVKRPFFGAADRQLIAQATGFSITKPADDDLTRGRIKRTVSFNLPRGSYATVVLRALGQ